jgi:hypothetical protein
LPTAAISYPHHHLRARRNNRERIREGSVQGATMARFDAQAGEGSTRNEGRQQGKWFMLNKGKSLETENATLVCG